MPTDERSNGAAAIPGPDQPQGSSASTSSQGGDQETKAKVNWQDDPEYRRQQAEKDRRFAALEAELNQRKAAEREAKLAGMDKYEREKYLREEAEQERDKAKADAAYEKKLQQYYDDIEEISKKYGVKKSVIARAKSYDDAVALAEEWLEDHPSSNPAQPDDDKQEKSSGQQPRRNTGDMGSGSKLSGAQVSMKKAIESNDMTAFMKAQRELAKQG